MRHFCLPDIASLAVIKQLSKIELISSRQEDINESDIDEDDFSASTARKRILLKTKHKRIDEACSILKASSGTSPKQVRVSYWQKITGTEHMAEITHGHYWVGAEEFEA